VVLLAVIFAALGQMKRSRPIVGELDSGLTVPFEEAVFGAHYIMDAECTGSGTTDHGKEFVFRPVEILKGQADAPEEIRLELQGNSMPEYRTGETYLLLLERQSSVYYTGYQYTLLWYQSLSEADSQWEQYHEQIRTLVASDKSIVSGKAETQFIEGTSVEEVIAFAENIFLVRIDSLLVDDHDAHIASYSATVLKALKNTPAADGSIYLTLFSHTVEPGDTCIVMLADAQKTDSAYTLAAREYSVYSLAEAETIPALKALLEQAGYDSADGK
jgi:hypothetical protein